MYNPHSVLQHCWLYMIQFLSLSFNFPTCTYVILFSFAPLTSIYLESYMNAFKFAKMACHHLNIVQYLFLQIWFVDSVTYFIFTVCLTGR